MTTTTTTTTSEQVGAPTNAPGPGTRGAERAGRPSTATTSGSRTAIWVAATIVVILAAVLAAVQPWATTDEAEPVLPGMLDGGSAAFAEKELVGGRLGSAAPESLSPREEFELMRDRARERQAPAPVVDGTASLQDEIELMRERNRLRARTSESLTPRQEHELLVGR